MPHSPYDHLIQQYLGAQEHMGSESVRLDSLRADCLERDGHRCVVTRKFDLKTVQLRDQESPGNALDDDGILLDDNEASFAVLELSHIIPRSLTKALDSVRPAFPDISSSTDLLSLPRNNLPSGSLICLSPIPQRSFKAETLTAHAMRSYLVEKSMLISMDSIFILKLPKDRIPTQSDHSTIVFRDIL